MRKWQKTYPQRGRAGASSLEECKYILAFKKTFKSIYQSGDSKLAFLSEAEPASVSAPERPCLNANSSFHFFLFWLVSNYSVMAFCEWEKINNILTQLQGQKDKIFSYKKKIHKKSAFQLMQE